MLKTITEAIRVKGRKNAVIARELERAPHTVNQWFGGQIYIPHRVRYALDTALGAGVDWEAYEVEFAEAKARRVASPAPPPPPKPPAPPATTAPEAPKRPASAPRRITATPPAKPPTKAPAAPPVKQPGLLARFLAPTEDLFVD